MENVANQVKSIIAAKLNVEVSEILDSANIQNDLGADSLDLVELVMDFEKEFSISISDEEVSDNIQTVADTISYIESKLK